MDVLRISEWGWRRSRRLSRRGNGPGGILEDALRLASQRLQILSCFGRNLCLSCGPSRAASYFCLVSVPIIDSSASVSTTHRPS